MQTKRKATKLQTGLISMFIATMAVIGGAFGAGQAAAFSANMGYGFNVTAPDRRACNGYIGLTSSGSAAGIIQYWSRDPNTGVWAQRTSAYKPAGQTIRFGVTSGAGSKTVASQFRIPQVRTPGSNNTTLLSTIFPVAPC